MADEGKFPDVEHMYRDAIYSVPVDFSWDASTNEDFGSGDETTWRFVEHRSPDGGDTARCDDCDEDIAYLNGRGWFHKVTLDYDLADNEEEALAAEEEYDHDATPDADWHREGCEGPMMNYWYPLDIGSEGDAADLISDLPLCVVAVDDETGLALTGGGMDLSWEICEAFMRLGSLPPVHFCRLPKMAGRGTSERDRWIIAGCARAVAIMRLDADWILEQLAQF